MKDFNLKPIGEHSYSWADGFTIGNTQPKYEGGMRQIDWDTIQLILSTKEFDMVQVGLAEDWYQTHAVIFEDGELIKKENDGAGFYGTSKWATPSVKLTKNGQTGSFECWILGDSEYFPEWMADARVVSDYDDYSYDDDGEDEE